MYVLAVAGDGLPLPLVLNFHGFGGTAEGHMCHTDMHQLADSESFILVYPQGAQLDGVSHWNFALESPDNKSNTDDLGFVGAMIDDIAASQTNQPRLGRGVVGLAGISG